MAGDDSAEPISCDASLGRGGGKVARDAGATGREPPPPLPPPATERWVIRRKAEVVEAVRRGVITLQEACERYQLSADEFLSWQRLIDRHGLGGLRVTKLQNYRSRDVRPRR